MPSPASGRVCFIHVPKCGGTSIAAALRRAQGLAEGSPAMVTIDSAASARLGERLDTDILTLRWQLALYELQAGRARVLHGHFPCPPETLDWFGAEVTFLTILRNPVERWISHYLYDRYKTGSDHYRMELGVEEYLASPLGQANGRLICNYFARRGSTGAAAVAEACQTLARLPIVAILEDLSTLTGPYRRLLGRELVIEHERPSPAPERRHDFDSPQVRRTIERVCADDIAVMESVREQLRRD